MVMHQMLIRLWAEDTGQDLIEYSLLITFIAIACLAFVGSGRPAVKAIWTQSNAQLTSANSVAGGS
jgi:Flp pilus assembly pilin Flp